MRGTVAGKRVLVTETLVAALWVYGCRHSCVALPGGSARQQHSLRNLLVSDDPRTKGPLLVMPPKPEALFYHYNVSFARCTSTAKSRLRICVLMTLQPGTLGQVEKTRSFLGRRTGCLPLATPWVASGHTRRLHAFSFPFLWQNIRSNI